MKKFLTIPLLFTSFVLFGQGRFVTQVYQYHFIDGDYFRPTNEINYFFEVFNDTTVKVEIFTHYFGFMPDYYARNTFLAKGRLIGDTLGIGYQPFFPQAQPGTSQLVVEIASGIYDKFSLCLSSLFIIKGNTLVAVDGILPALNKSSLAEAALLEKRYENSTKKKTGNLGCKKRTNFLHTNML